MKTKEIFGGLPEETWKEISRAVENRTVAPGTIIFRQGDPGDKFYIIQSGRVRVFRQDEGGLETELSLLGPGESFGEMALLTGETRAANTEAVEETRLMVISKEQFEHILKDYPAVSLAFVKQMSEWLRKADKVIGKVAQQQYRTSRLSWIDFVLIIGVSLILAFVFNKSNPNGIPLFPELPDRKAVPAVTVTEAVDEVKKGQALIVDAGPANFYEKKHIKGAINMPLALFEIVYMMTLAAEDKTKKVIVYGGTPSKLYDLELANKLLLRGHKDVTVLKGGITAWEKKGYPVEAGKGKK